jgi:hypothetical protein
MLPSFGIQRSVIHMCTHVSEKHITYIHRIENQQDKKPEYCRWLVVRLIFDLQGDGDEIYRNVCSHTDYRTHNYSREKLKSYTFLNYSCVMAQDGLKNESPPRTNT